MIDKEKYMMHALEEAKKANTKEEIPVGVIIVKDEKIIARAHNKKEKNNDPTKHAEIIAIQKACRKIKDWRLNNCLLFVTLEPCIMCMGAIIEARVNKVFCGTKNKKYHFLIQEIAKNNNINMENGILEEECEGIIKSFFAKKRKK